MFGIEGYSQLSDVPFPCYYAIHTAQVMETIISAQERKLPADSHR